VREIEVKRDNEILGDKIINIFTIKNHKNMKPLFEIKKNKQTTTNKYFTNRVEQDNQQMLKRLIDLPSNYDKKLWYKDFEKSQEYKKNICEFPSIKFLKDYNSNSNNNINKEFSNERKLHTSQLKQNKNNEFNNNYNNNFINGFFNTTNKKRSSTSYSKFKNTEKLYASKYFQNTEDTSKYKFF